MRLPLYSGKRQTLPTTPAWKVWATSEDRLSSLQEPEKRLGPFLATDLPGEFGQPPFCSLAHGYQLPVQAGAVFGKA